MGIFDNAKARLEDAVEQHGDKIDDGLDKAAKFVDDKTGGKHADQIASATEKAKEGLDKLGNRNDGPLDGPLDGPA